MSKILGSVLVWMLNKPSIWPEDEERERPLETPENEAVSKPLWHPFHSCLYGPFTGKIRFK